MGRPIISIRNNNSKICKICNYYKNLNEFPINGKTKNGLLTYRSNCKKCFNKNWKYRILSTLTSRERSTKRAGNSGYSRIKIRSKLINIKFLELIKNKQNGLCYWLKIPIDFTIKDKLRQPSLDRLDNSKDYDIDNVVLTTLFANLGRRDATIIEMENFIKNYYKNLK